MRVAAFLALLGLGACSERVVWPDPDLSWMEARTCPEQTGDRVFVTNSFDDTISWIDVDTMTLVCQEPVGLLPPEDEGPHHGGALADGSAFFVGLSNSVPGSGSGPHGSHGTGDARGYLLKYDGRTHELAGRRLVDRNPGDVRITPNGAYVLQSHYDLLRVLEYLTPMGDAAPVSPNSTLAVIDPVTMEDIAFVEICPTGHGIAVSPDSDKAFVTCSTTDQVAIVTLAEPWNQVEIFSVGAGTTPLGAPRFEPYAIAYEPNTSRIWVSNINIDAQDLRIFEGSTPIGAPISTAPGTPYFGDFWRDYYVVPLQVTDTLGFVDRTTHVVETMPLSACVAPHAVLTLEGDRLLVVCEGDHMTPGMVVVVDPTNRRVIGEPLTVGIFPDDLVLVPMPR